MRGGKLVLDDCDFGLMRWTRDYYTRDGAHVVDERDGDETLNRTVTVVLPPARCDVIVLNVGFTKE